MAGSIEYIKGKAATPPKKSKPLDLSSIQYDSDSKHSLSSIGSLLNDANTSNGINHSTMDSIAPSVTGALNNSTVSSSSAGVTDLHTTMNSSTINLNTGFLNPYSGEGEMSSSPIDEAMTSSNISNLNI
jgi:hypothetical protein